MPFLGSVYQIFGLYPEIYYGMISAELQEEAQRNISIIIVQKLKRKNKAQMNICAFFIVLSENTVCNLQES
ncbi:hypothetical protein JFT70_09715 [Bacillus sp. TH11]|nr:hypothetical protein [Bacillus sp. TH11]